MTDTLEQLRETAMKLADSALWSLSDTDLLSCLDQAHRAELAVTAVKLHLILEAESRGLPPLDLEPGGNGGPGGSRSSA